MYLAKHVGGWSTPQIGRFYNGRHHTTVLYAIQKIEQLRRRDESVDDLLEMLCGALNSKADVPMSAGGIDWQEAYIDAVAERVLRHLRDGQNGLLDRVQLSSAEGRRNPGTYENLP